MGPVVAPISGFWFCVWRAFQAATRVATKRVFLARATRKLKHSKLLVSCCYVMGLKMRCSLMSKQGVDT